MFVTLCMYLCVCVSVMLTAVQSGKGKLFFVFILLYTFYFVNRHCGGKCGSSFPSSFFMLTFCELIGGLKSDVENYRNYCLTLTLYNHTEIYFTDKISIFRRKEIFCLRQFKKKTP